MKTGYPIRINTARASLPPGGNWQRNDPVAQGKVQILEVGEPGCQAMALLEELRRLQGNGLVDLGHCAVLGREWKDLEKVRGVCEEYGMPVRFCWGNHGSFPRLTLIRENADLLSYNFI